MAFKDTYRLEKVYYENMWTLLRSLKSLQENPSADTLATVKELLDNAIADNESIILIYKNLGELYAEIAQKFADLQKDLLDLANNLESWKDEINQKIDDNHNYLMGLIRDLEDRVTSLEGRVTSLEGRMDTAEDNIEDLQGRMTTAEDDIDALEGRMDTAEGDIDALEGRMDTAEGDIDALEGRMDTAEDDIDGLQGDVSDLQQNKQDTLTAGFGIEIDANNEISVDTNDVQEKLIAGQNITFTPDATDPTKTVIDAQGGASYTQGNGIVIDNNKIYSDIYVKEYTSQSSSHDFTNVSIPSSLVELPHFRNFSMSLGSSWTWNINNDYTKVTVIYKQNAITVNKVGLCDDFYGYFTYGISMTYKDSNNDLYKQRVVRIEKPAFIYYDGMSGDEQNSLFKVHTLLNGIQIPILPLPNENKIIFSPILSGITAKVVNKGTNFSLNDLVELFKVSITLK